MSEKTEVELIEVSNASRVLTPRMGDSANIVDILREHFGDDGGRMHTGAEIGCHRGATSAKLLRQFPNLILWCVDPYASYTADHRYRQTGDSLAKLTSNEQHKHYLAAKEATEFAANRRMFVKFASTTAAKIVSTPKLSFAFLDGSHAYEDVRDDCEAWWPKIEAQGVLSGHDYGHPRDGKQFGVKRAVDEFAEKHGLAVALRGTVWAIVKP